MKCVLINKPGGLEALELVDVPEPMPESGEVVIRTKAMAVSRPDIMIRKGTYPWGPALPANPGNELAGIVDAVGPDVSHLRVGQPVLLSSRELPERGGCYAEMVKAPASAVHLLPEGACLEQAVVLPSYLVAYAMLYGLGLHEGTKTIFVNGVSGVIGTGLTQLAKAEGITVIGSVGAAHKADFARKSGVDHVLFHKTENMLERVMDITDGRGVDVVFDHVIGRGFPDLVSMVADFGTVVAYNVFSPMPEEDVFGHMRHLSLRSPALRIFNIHTYDRDLPTLRRYLAELIALFSQGWIGAPIGARIPFFDVKRAHQMFEKGELCGKIVMNP